MDSNNFAMLSAENMQLLYKQIHSTWLLDSLFLFVLSPLGVVSGVLNLLSFIALSLICDTSTTHKAIYQYLRIH